jgi:DNA-binding transcriptional MocR family regulator
MQSISSPSITQASIAHFLQKGRYEYHLKNLRRALHTQYLRYTQAITDYFPDNAKLSRPAGGFVLWVELGKKVNGFRLRNEALQEKIVFMPGKIFSASGRYHHCIRISFGTPYSAQIDDGLQTLGQLIRKAQQS